MQYHNLLVGFFLLACVHLSIQGRRRISSEFSCDGKPDGKYPDPDDNSAYYTCETTSSHDNCPEGECFENGECTTSEFSCVGKPDGKYPDPLDETMFYMCSNEIASHFKCPADTVYDPETENCEYRAKLASHC